MEIHSDDANTYSEESRYEKSLFLRLIACTSLLCFTSIIGGLYFPIKFIDGNDSSLAKYLHSFIKGADNSVQSISHRMESSPLGMRNLIAKNKKQLPDVERIYDIEDFERVSPEIA